jgi:tetrahydromethanopterin S-methyltransferase subunit H
MATNINIANILIKRANTVTANTYVGPLGELLVDTGLRTLRLQDGATPGGMSTLATQSDLSKVAAAIAGISVIGNIEQLVTALQSANSAATIANVTALQANANIQAIWLANLQSNVYANTSVASYLPTYTGNIKTNLINFVYGAQIFSGNSGTGTNEIGITANIRNDLNGFYVSEGPSAIAQMYTQGSIYFNSNTAGQSKQWALGTDGNLTFPDSTVQATAYQGPEGQTSFATAAYVNAAINSLVNSAPGTLDTLGEIAANLASEAGAIGGILSSITSTNANVTAANVAWQANASAQASQIAGANVNISNLQANIGSFYTYANATYGVGAANYSNTNVAAYLTTSTIISNITSNITAANTAWQANAATQLSQITAANTNISALQANLGATQIWANANIQTLSANIGSYQIWVNANVTALYNSILGANTNAAAQAGLITTLQSNAGTQSDAIAGANAAIVTANTAMKSYVDAVTTAWTANAGAQANSLLGANAAIVTANTALKGYVDTQLSTLTNGASTALDTLLEIGTALGNNANFSATMVTWLGNITANATAANTNISALQANLGATQIWANANIASIRANLGATQIWANANIASITANLGATQIWANANIASINANLGGYYTWANANVAGLYNSMLGANANAVAQQTQITSLVTNANANTSAYLASGSDSTITTLQNAIVYIQGTLSGNVGQALASQASVDAANAAITGANIAWQANAAAQAGQITGANAAIVTANTALKGYVDAQLSTLTNGASTALDTLLEIGTALGNNANFSATMVTWLGNISANVTAANTNISALQSNTGALQNAITTANTAMKAYVDANAAAQAATLSSFTSGQLTLTNSIATTQVNIANLQSSVSSLQSNVGGFQTWANSNFITSSTTYSNSNVASYLPTHAGNISALAIRPAGNPTTGFNGLFVGLQSGYVTVPSLEAQFSANSNTYSQINSQNISNGNQSTTDYVATANNGTNFINFIDMGIAGNTYDGTQPNNSLGTSLYPNDGYVYVQGNTAGVVGGNLVLGTTTSGTGIRFLAGGIDSANISVAINNPGTNPSNNSSGALVVTGGVGISGNINAGVYNTSLHNIKGNVLFGIGNVVASADSTITINQNTTAPLLAPNNVVHISASDGKLAQYGADAFGGNVVTAGLYMRKARGTSASPSAVQANDLIGVMAARGYGTTNFANAQTTTPTHIGIYAAENFTDTSQGTGITMRITANGSISASTIAQFTTNSVTISSNLNVGIYDYSIHNIKGNVLFGIGNVVASSDSTLTINQNSSTPLSAPNNVVHMSALDGKNAQYGADSFGAGATSALYLRKARGTSASPSAVQAGDFIGSIGARGYGTTGFTIGTISPQMAFVALENFTDQAQGMGIYLRVPPVGSNTASNVATFTTNSVTISSNLNVGVYDYSLHNIKGNLLLGIGNVVASSDSVLTVNQNSSTPLLAPNNVIHVSALDGKSAQYGADSFGAGATSALYLRKARGTSASPSAVQAGDFIGSIGARGYGLTGYTVGTISPQMAFVALENFTDQAQGMGIYLRVPPVGSNTASNVATFTTNAVTISSNLNVGVYDYSIHNIKGNLLLGIGNVVASSDSALTINQNSSTPLLATNNVVHMSALDGKSAQYGADSFGAGATSAVYLRKARGTSASPSAVMSGDFIGAVSARGYGLNGFSVTNTTPPQMAFVALENFDNFANGTGIYLRVVPIGANTASNVATFTSNLTTITSNLTVAGNIVQQSAYYETYGNISNTGGNLTCNFNLGTTFYAALTANVTANFTNVNATSSTVTGATIIIDQGAIAYRVANVQVNGVNQTVKWLGATTGVGTASNTDVMSFSLINLGSGNYRVLGQIRNYA